MKNLSTLLLLFVLIGNPIKINAQENKVATIIVSGSGNTLDNSIDNALRNALEQAFGTFISSDTEILNDELVKDKIVSISNGNIENYEVLSQVELSDQTWNSTVKARVSVGKLITFCKNEGINAEFNGSMFSLNIKQQILNEKNEAEVIQNMNKVLYQIGEHLFDYSINVQDPIAMNDDNSKWGVNLDISVTLNQNINNYTSYLLETLNGISLTESEVKKYLKLNKHVYSILINDKNNQPVIVYLRKTESAESIVRVISSLSEQVQNIEIDNGAYQFNLRGKHFKYGDNNFRPLLNSTHISYKYRGGFYGSLFKIYPVIDSDVERKGNPRYSYDCLGYKQIYVEYLIKSRRLLTSHEKCFAMDDTSKNEVQFRAYSSYIGEKYSNMLSKSLTGNQLSEDGDKYNPQKKYRPYFDIVVDFSRININKPVVIFKYVDILTMDNLNKVTGYSKI